MKKFYYVTNSEDLVIYRSVSGLGHGTSTINNFTDGLCMKGNEIRYMDEERVDNAQSGTSAVSIFGDSNFNMLGDPIPIVSIIEEFPALPLDNSWYLVSTISTGSGLTEHRNNLAWFGTKGSVIDWKYLSPFNGICIAFGTSSDSELDYVWDTISKTDKRWKRVDLYSKLV